VWSWKDGVLSPKDKDEMLWTKREYENFIIDLEFNLEPAANSGVMVYNTDLANWIPNTVEIQLLDDPAPKWKDIPPTWKCGGIFAHSAPLKAATKKAGEWNRMTIRCQGPRISVLLNGVLVTDMNMKDWKSGKKNPDGSDIADFEPRPLAEMATKGHIGLQGAHGGIPTHFRNLKIKPLD
jgi:3-keto-disaccharide hydrolase